MQVRSLSSLKVLIVADDPLARGGLVSLITSGGMAQVVAQLSSDDVRHASVYEADVVAWDLGASPSETLDRVARVAIDADGLPPVVALIDDASMAGRVWAAGAKGLLPRDVPASRLVAALAAAAEGVIVADEEFSGLLQRRSDTAPVTVEPLTPRETEVLRLMAEGYANKMIAARLEVSENTVKFHVNAVLGKMAAQSRTEAVTRATRMGLLPL